MQYIEDIQGADLIRINYYYFDMKNNDYVNICINGVDRDYKIYQSKKGYYINYKGKRYYNKTLLIRNYNY